MRSSIRDLSLFDFVVIPLCVACSVHEASLLGLERPQGGSPLENRHENGPRHARSLAVPVPVRGTVFDSKLIINYDSYIKIMRNTRRARRR